MPVYEIAGGNSTGVAALVAGSTNYFGVPGSGRTNAETSVQAEAKDTMTLRNLIVRITSNGTSTNSTVMSRVNVANGAQSVTIGAALTGLFEDTGNIDSLVVGNTWAMQWVVGTGGTIIFTDAGFLLDTTTSRSILA